MPLREFKKGIVEGPAPVKWAWVVAVILLGLLVTGVGYGLFCLISLMID